MDLKDLATLLEERVFVDYFNVFLSLPIFSQKLLYRFSSKDFELDPVNRTNMDLEKNKLMRWLLDDRIAFFQQSHLYLDYKLNCKLRESQVKVTESSHKMYREIEYPDKVQFDKEYVDLTLGHVLGMCRFREFLSGTPGEILVQFWTDVEQMKSITKRNVQKKLWLWRELQHKYFKIGGLIQLKDNQMWKVLQEGSAILERVDCKLRRFREEYKACGHDHSLQELQDAVLTILKEYWLHKYFLHLKYPQIMQLQTAAHNNTDSTIETLEDNMQTINIGLKMAEGKPILELDKSKKPKGANAQIKWGGLFSPQAKVDDSFVSVKRDVVTVHDDGHVSVEPTDPEIMDKMLQKFRMSSPQPLPDSIDSSRYSSPEGRVISPVRSKSSTDLSKKIQHAVTTKDLPDKSESNTSVQLPSCPPTPEPQKHKTIQGFVTANQDYLKGFMDGFSTKLSLPPSQQETKKEIKKISTAPAAILPSISPKVRRKVQNIQKKPKIKAVELPPIEQKQGSCVDTCVQEAMYASRRHEEPHVSPLMSESTSVMETEYLRAQKRIFVCAIAADQLAGGPFEAFLQRTDNPYAIKSMHFWHESVVYLSTKYSTSLEHYDRVRLQRARQLVLHYLETNSAEQMDLPREVTENLLRLLPADRGDNLLRYAQDSVTTILEKAWKLYTKVDRMVFNKNCLQARRKTILQKILTLSDARKLELLKQVHEKTPTPAAAKSKEQKPRSPVKDKKEKKAKGPSNKVYSLATGTLPIRGRRHSLKSPIQTDPIKSPSPTDNTQNKEKDTKQKLIDKIMAEEKEQTEEKKYRRTHSPSENVKSEKAKKLPNLTSKQLVSTIKAKQRQKGKKKKRTNEGIRETVRSARTVPTHQPKVLDEAELNSLKVISERRMWRALQLTLYISRLDYEGLPGVDKLCLKDLEFDAETYGSLHIKPLVVIRIEKPVKMPKYAKPRRTIKKKTSVETPVTPLTKQPSVQAKKEEDPMLQYETLPVFARPYKNFKDGRWVVRPNKAPKTMMEIFMDPCNLEFFKRYMQFTGKDMPLLLWEAVEQLKYIKEAKSRHQHVSHTFKKFFLNKNNFAALDCKSDVLVQMTLMDKMTPALLLSAQSVIAKDIETKWFEPYALTFPENEGTTESTSSTKDTSSISTTSTEKERLFARKAKDWAKAKAGVVHTVRMREQWKRVARIINRFRKGLWNPQLCDQFIEYLNRRIAAEYQKNREQRIHLSSKEGHVPVRKVIKDKVVDMTRLPSDVRFLCETERYLKLCDAATEAAFAGTYGVADHAIIERKAAIIMECFIESEISPRVQINITPELASTIESCYHGGMLDRTLFHEATMAVYPHVIFLWQRFIQGLSTSVKTNTDTSGYQYWSNKHSDLHLDFFNLLAKRVRKQCDDDHPKLQFSLMYGLRLLLPTSNYYNHSSSLDDLFPGLVRDIMEGPTSGRKDQRKTGSPRETSAQTPREIENTQQYRKMAKKIKTLLSNRRNAVVRANNKVGLGRRKELEVKPEVKEDVDTEFTTPGIHVRPKPYKSVSSL